MYLAAKTKTIWRRKRVLISGFFVVSSIILFLYYLDIKIRQFFQSGVFIKFPTSRFKLYLFLFKPILLLAPFLLCINVIGIHLLIRRNRFRVIVVPVQENLIDTPIDRVLLRQNDRLVLETLFSSSGQMLQVDLIKKTRLKGYQITRILNRFEGLGWIARKRYGMTNLIYLRLRPEKT